MRSKQQRAEDVAQALASARIEGYTDPDPAFLADMQAYVGGTKTTQEMIDATIARAKEEDARTRHLLPLLAQHGGR
jgi:hypothetical protein